MGRYSYYHLLSSIEIHPLLGCDVLAGVGSSKSGYPRAGPVPLHFLVVQGSEDIGAACLLQLF